MDCLMLMDWNNGNHVCVFFFIIVPERLELCFDMASDFGKCVFVLWCSNIIRLWEIVNWFTITQYDNIFTDWWSFRSIVYGFYHWFRCSHSLKFYGKNHDVCYTYFGLIKYCSFVCLPIQSIGRFCGHVAAIWVMSDDIIVISVC